MKAADKQNMPAASMVISISGRIVLAFLGVLFLGSLLLWLPISHTGEVRVTYLDALFTATTCVCVTGLVTVEIGAAYSAFGQTVILLLIQTGGLGAAVLGIGAAMLAGRAMSLRARHMIQESWNLGGLDDLGRIFRRVLLMTAAVEFVGAMLGWWIFAGRYPVWKALWLGVFHSVSAFNNAGIDVMGLGNSMVSFAEHVPMNLLTMALIVTGGIGYLVLLDVFARPKKKKPALHTRIVLWMTAVLIAVGTVLLKITDDISWLSAAFHSVSARTAGFASCNLGELSHAGLFVICILMFIGASPGSTGGGVKTTTVFAAFVAVRAFVSGKDRRCFRRQLSENTVNKAFLVLLSALMTLVLGVLLLCILEPEMEFSALFFEAVSAFGTAGLSVGITSQLCAASKLVIIALMFLGRLGPMTVAAMIVMRKPPAFRYSEEEILIG